MHIFEEINILFFLIITTSVILILGWLIIAFVFKYQKKQLENLTMVDEIKHNHEEALLKSQIEIQEATFNDIAREIHDNIGQKLSLAKLYLNTLPNCENEQIDHAKTLLTESISELSNLSRSMNSTLIEENGLIRVLNWELEKINKCQEIHGNFELHGNETDLPNDIEIVLFRIFQEAVNNIIKHANAKTFDARLIFNDQSITMEIEDNGIGVQRDKEANGSGIHNMQKRTKMLNGDFSLKSSPNGTIINIKIPIL